MSALDIILRGLSYKATEIFLATPLGQFLLDTIQTGAKGDLIQKEKEGTLTDEEKERLSKVRQAEFELSNLQSVEENRFMENIFIPIDWAMALTVFKLAKEKQWTVLQNLFKIREDNIARMVVALAQASTGNLISGWAGQHNIAMLLEHNYMIRKGGAAGLVAGMNWLTGSMALAEVIGNISVPQAIVFSSGAGKTATKEEFKGLPALVKLLTKEG